MKVSLSWLKEYIDLPFSPAQIAETLTLAGIEVDQIETPQFSFEGVVIGKVLDAKPHPNADRLQIATVSDGEQEFQVVCGAPNCRKGLVTAFAKIGASLKDPEGKIWKIKKSKIRDVESFGMLCSESELGLSSNSDGILELSDNHILGKDLTSLYGDTFFEISLTPNLGHCLSIYGIARELSAFFKTPLKKLSSSFQENGPKSSFSVEIEDKKHCLSYSCRLVKNVKVGPSPDWLVQKLQGIGLRTINNVVDISNYVMMITGQPLHFFDAHKIHDRKVFISSSREGDSVTTLDQERRNLPKGSLIIRDSQKILAIAGIMGSFDSSVTQNTSEILIESAVFDPISIRKTSKDLGLKTDSSHRFEKGIDPLMNSYALDLASQLLQELANATSSEQKIELIATAFTPKKIVCRIDRVNKLIGVHLSLREIVQLLDRLEIKIINENTDSLEVLIPSYRNDLREEIDLVEEIARLYGFNNLPKKPPLHYTSTLVDSPVFSFENKVRNILLGEGLQEFMTCDLISPALSKLVEEPALGAIEILSVLHSKSSDYSVLRHSLLPGLLQVVKYNCDRGCSNLAGFEVGRLHLKKEGEYQEPVSIGIILSGLKIPHHHRPKVDPVDFFDIKGCVENLVDTLHIDQVTFEESHLHSLQPGRQAYIKRKGNCLGVLGEVHPSTLARIGISQRVYFADIHLNDLLQLEKPLTSIQMPALYPSSERDWTVSLRKNTPTQEVLSCIQNLAPPVLEKVFLLDLFESEQIGADRKNVTWRFVYRDPQKTLDVQTVEQVHTKLLQKVAEKLQSCIL